MRQQDRLKIQLCKDQKVDDSCNLQLVNYTTGTRFDAVIKAIENLFGIETDA